MENVITIFIMLGPITRCSGGKILRKLSAKLKIIMVCMVGILLIALIIAVTAWKISESKPKSKPSWKVKSDLREIPEKISEKEGLIIKNSDYIFYINPDSNSNGVICRIKVDGTDDHSLKVTASDLIGIEDGLIYKMNLDGSNAARLYDNIGVSCRTIIASGKWIYVTSYDNNDYQIYRVKIDGSSKNPEKVN